MWQMISECSSMIYKHRSLNNSEKFLMQKVLRETISEHEKKQEIFI